MQASTNRNSVVQGLMLGIFIGLCFISLWRELPIGCWLNIGDCRVIAFDGVELSAVSGDADATLQSDHLVLVDQSKGAVERRIWLTTIEDSEDSHVLNLLADDRPARVPFTRILVIQKRNGENFQRWEYLLDLKKGRVRQRQPAERSFALQRHRGGWLLKREFFDFEQNDTIQIRIDPAYGSDQSGALIIRRFGLAAK